MSLNQAWVTITHDITKDMKLMMNVVLHDATQRSCIMHCSAVLSNQHVCVSSKKLCVIEFMFMEPIIGNL